MGRFQLKRRTLLRGIGGLALPLPALEIMAPSQARAGGGIPKRYAVFYGGTSLGCYTSVTGSDDMFAPTAVGPDYDLPRALEPLGAGPLQIGGTGLDVRDEVTVVTGLKIPWATNGVVPSGGRVVNFHGSTLIPQISGTKTTVENLGREPTGPTSDQIVADQIAGSSPHRMISYRVQAASYVSFDGGSGLRLSWAKNPDGSVTAYEPTASPRAAYESLFLGFIPTDDPEAAAAARRLLSRRRSILDLVKGSVEGLLPRLGHADKIRMEQHLDGVNTVEKRLEELEIPTGGGCELPEHPGEDPPIGGAHDKSTGMTDFNEDGAYSNEELRAQILIDLAHMAFACELTNVATIRLTMDQCQMNVGPMLGYEGQTMHGLGHTGYSWLPMMSDGVAWHVKHFARLVAKLRDTPEIDGSSMIDHTAMVHLFEGGHGFDAETDTPNVAHSSTNMGALIAGGAGGLKAGHHVPALDAHPAQVVVSAMQAVGVDAPLGDVSSRIDDLFL